MFAINTENLNALKYHIFLKKTLGLSICFSKSDHEYKKYVKKKNQLIALITNIK